MANNEQLRNIIKSISPINMESFIELAMYHETHGYYQSRVKIGKDGDFITSPTISSLFGEIIGIWIASRIINNNIDKVNIAEFGGGHGEMMSDINRVIDALKIQDRIAKIYMVEKSSKMRNEQQKNNQKWSDRMEWVHGIDDQETQDNPLIIVTNELFDSLPIRQYVFESNDWYEIGVLFDNNEPKIFKLHEKQTDLVSQFIDKYDLNKPKQNDVIEIPVLGIGIFDQMCKMIKKNKNSAMLHIDYGFLDHKYGNTLQALSEHKKLGILDKIGFSDITHLVNFSILAKVAKANKITYKTSTQRDFLISNGIMERLARLSTSPNHLTHLKSVKRITDPRGMGGFNVMEFGGNL